MERSPHTQTGRTAHTQRDTDRANSRTFKRRNFMAPPRSEIEAQVEAEQPKHTGIAREHFIDELPRESEQPAGGLPDGYVDTEVVLCRNGSPVNGSILFKEAED